MNLDSSNENLFYDSNMHGLNNSFGSSFGNNYNENDEFEQFSSEIEKEKEPDIDNPLNNSTKQGSKKLPDEYNAKEKNENKEEKTVIHLPENSISIKEEEEEKEEINNDKKNETNDNNFITFDNIKKDIFPKLDLPETTKNKININKEIIKRIEEKKPILMYLNNTISSEAKDTVKPKFGRAKLGDKSIRKHNKYSYDNVMKKVKKEIFNYALIFINQILTLLLNYDKKYIISENNVIKYGKGDYLKPLNYDKIINTVQKGQNLQLLQMELKDLFSQNISQKFSNFTEDTNKKIIDDILTNEKENKNIMFALHLKLEEWLDFFSHKKEIDILDNIQKEKKVTFERAEELLNKIAERDDLYFSIFVYHFYNYKSWFKSKRSHINKKSKKKVSK
jgi:hypothetical protein